MDWKGNEFIENETALINWGGSVGLKKCTVLKWTNKYGGWWYVKLENGGLHYTKNLVKK